MNKAKFYWLLIKTRKSTRTMSLCSAKLPSCLQLSCPNGKKRYESQLKLINSHLSLPKTQSERFQMLISVAKRVATGQSVASAGHSAGRHYPLEDLHRSLHRHRQASFAGNWQRILARRWRFVRWLRRQWIECCPGMRKGSGRKAAVWWSTVGGRGFRADHFAARMLNCRRRIPIENSSSTWCLLVPPAKTKTKF